MLFWKEPKRAALFGTFGYAIRFEKGSFNFGVAASKHLQFPVNSGGFASRASAKSLFVRVVRKNGLVNSSQCARLAKKVEAGASSRTLGDCCMMFKRHSARKKQSADETPFLQELDQRRRNEIYACFRDGIAGY